MDKIDKLIGFLKATLSLPYEGITRLGEYNKEGDYTLIKRRGSKVLAVCHADWVTGLPTDSCPVKVYFLDGEKRLENALVFARSLDDRLGLFVALCLLRDLNMDILITNNEEKGQSTAKKFKTTKKYNWVVEFDRRGEDVVLYGYDKTTEGLKDKLKEAGFEIGNGSYSDICVLELGVGAFNVGIGYKDEHRAECSASLDITLRQAARFREFYNKYVDVLIPSTYKAYEPKTYGYGSYDWRGGNREPFYNTDGFTYDWVKKCYYNREGKAFVLEHKIENGVGIWNYVPKKGEIIVPPKKSIVVYKKKQKIEAGYCPICRSPLDGWVCPECGDLSTLTCDYCQANPINLQEARQMYIRGLCNRCISQGYGYWGID